jgi:hypothetical protein
MHGLPRTISVLNATLAAKEKYVRLDPGSGPLRDFRERDYDDLIERHSDALGELLLEAAVIEKGSHLRYLGRQVASIDVLFAEVDSDGTFRRLVIVEDKLLRNPTARRAVLAQILEYADAVQRLTVERLAEKLTTEIQDWIEENEEDIASSLRTGDFLLVICGDEIHDRVAKLAERFAKEANPLSQLDLCLIALTFYRNEKGDFLLVPALAGAVGRSDREFIVQVKVLDSQSRELRAETQWSNAGNDPNRFFTKTWAKFSANEIAACRDVVAALSAGGVPGLSSVPTTTGRPMVVLDGTRFNRVKVLLAATSAPALRDAPDRNRGLLTDPEAAKTWKEFQEALLKVPGARWGGKAQLRVYMPVLELRSNVEIVVSALHRLARALQ